MKCCVEARKQCFGSNARECVTSETNSCHRIKCKPEYYMDEVAEAKAALKATEADEATEREKVAEEGTEHWSFRGCC